MLECILWITTNFKVSSNSLLLPIFNNRIHRIPRSNPLKELGEETKIITIILASSQRSLVIKESKSSSTLITVLKDSLLMITIILLWWLNRLNQVVARQAAYLWSTSKTRSEKEETKLNINRFHNKLLINTLIYTENWLIKRHKENRKNKIS